MHRKKVKPVMFHKTGIRYSEEVRNHAIKLRRETGATCKQIAERIGTCPETVRRWLMNHLVQLLDEEKERHLADVIKRVRKDHVNRQCPQLKMEIEMALFPNGFGM